MILRKFLNLYNNRKIMYSLPKMNKSVWNTGMENYFWKCEINTQLYTRENWDDSLVVVSSQLAKLYRIIFLRAAASLLYCCFSWNYFKTNMAANVSMVRGSALSYGWNPKCSHTAAVKLHFKTKISVTVLPSCYTSLDTQVALCGMKQHENMHLSSI